VDDAGRGHTETGEASGARDDAGAYQHPCLRESPWGADRWWRKRCAQENGNCGGDAPEKPGMTTDSPWRSFSAGKQGAGENAGCAGDKMWTAKCESNPRPNNYNNQNL